MADTLARYRLNCRNLPGYIFGDVTNEHATLDAHRLGRSYLRDIGNAAATGRDNQYLHRVPFNG